jgi:hypothetical protein
MIYTMPILSAKTAVLIAEESPQNSINRFLAALLWGNNIPSPLEGEGRVRGHNYGPYSADSSQLAAG